MWFTMRGSERLKMQNPKMLEDEEEYLADELTQLCLQDIEVLNTSEELRTVSRDLKISYDSYSNKVIDYVNYLSKVGSLAEKKVILDGYQSKKERYKAKMVSIRQKREALGDDNITVYSLSSHQSQLGAVSSSEKVVSFLESQTLLCEENIMPSSGLMVHNLPVYDQSILETSNLSGTNVHQSNQDISITMEDPCLPVSRLLDIPGSSMSVYPTNDVLISTAKTDVRTSSATVQSLDPLFNNPELNRSEQGRDSSNFCRPTSVRNDDVHNQNQISNSYSTSNHMLHANSYPSNAGYSNAPPFNPGAPLFNPCATQTNIHQNHRLSLNDSSDIPIPIHSNSDNQVCNSQYDRPNVNYNPFRPSNMYSGPINDTMATRFLMKREINVKQLETFSGECTRFHGWVQKMISRLSGLQLNAYEIIDALESNTSGEAHNIITYYEGAAYADPIETLDLIWQDLCKNFGNPNRVFTELNNNLLGFSKIQSKDDLAKMKLLLRTCRLIDANMRYIDSLKIFDTEFGQSKIIAILPRDLFDKWRRIIVNAAKNCRYPSFKDLICLVEKAVDEVSVLDPPNFVKNVQTLHTSYAKSDSNPTVDFKNQKMFCYVHKSSTHNLSDCKMFLDLNFSDRIQLLRENHLCFNCLGNHMRRSCSHVPICKICKKRHNSALHDESRSGGNVLVSNTNVDTNSNNHNTANSNNHSKLSSRLAGSFSGNHQEDVSTTATTLCGSHTDKVRHNFSKVILVDISSPLTGKSARCYCIVDEQSSTSFISPELAKSLDVNGPEFQYTLNTMNGSKTFSTGEKISGLFIRGVTEGNSYQLPTMLTNCFIPNCTNEIASPEVVKSHPGIKKFGKYFPSIDRSAGVMALIGRNANELMKTTCYGDVAPFVHKTNLGWAVVGLIGTQDDDNNDINVLKTSVVQEHFDIQFTVPQSQFKGIDINSSLKSSMDRLSDDELPGRSQQDTRFDNIMTLGTGVNTERNIELPLPFKEDNPVMPDNRRSVYQRTKNTLDRISRDPVKLKQCVDAMSTYIEAGHVEPVPFNQQNPRLGKGWWLNVFPVFNPKKPNKTRLCFDSSATYQGVSLNQVLLQGPDRNNRLKDVLIKFRNGPIAISSDIEAMFHSFHLSENDRDFVRFYWHKNNDPQKELVQYRAKVQIFGNKPSPAIAHYGLQCAVDFKSDVECSVAAKNFVADNFYVDDALAAFDDAVQAVNVLKSAKDKLDQFNIRLHKIASNSPHVINSFPSSEIAECYAATDHNVVCGALGLSWDVHKDVLKFNIDLPSKEFTPRGVLSVNHSIFDPLGFLSPVLLEGRIMQREFMSSNQGKFKGVGLNWDDKFPQEFLHKWESWKTSLEDLKNVALTRSYYPLSMVPVEKIEIHAFSDASMDAIGYVLYLRSISNGKVNVAFLCAGSKVAPRAATSIPRLELCAALEASAATLKVRQELQVSPDNVYFYSDSRIVLGYLANSTRRFVRYVARRVEIINNLSNQSSWFYVSTETNPADIASRPKSPDVLMSSLWSSGPEFLWNIDYFPSHDECSYPADDLPELDSKVLATSLTTCEADHPLSVAINRSSSLKKLLGVIKVIWSVLSVMDVFKQRSGFHLAKRPSFSDITDEFVMKILVNHVQKVHKVVDMASYRNFSPFIDNDSIIRVGGRIKNAFIPFDSKHPMILPKLSSLARLVVIHYHHKTNHQGRTITLAAVRSAGYFIDGCRKLVSSIIKTCVICQKLRGKPVTPKMADLPLDRLEETPPFTNSGVDMFGPFIITDGANTRRNAATKKVWGLLFICMTTRAVHIESVPGLDVNSFRNALRRFFALRGVCRHLRSDNGSNFVAAQKQIDSVNALKCLQDEAASHKCEWIFNPPYASHFGGSWERAIGSVRKIMNASLLQIGKRAITRDELDTLFKEASAIINNTPLYQVSAHPDDILPITPANLMTLKDAPNPSTMDTFTKADLNAYAHNRYRRVQQLANEFWHRWRKHYISELQARSKWTKEYPNVNPGDVVILKDKNLPRNEWPTAVIDEVFHSPDGIVRSCKIRTSKGVYRRAVCDLVILISLEREVSRP